MLIIVPDGSDTSTLKLESNSLEAYSVFSFSTKLLSIKSSF